MTTGLGKGFAPSANAANKALGGTVRQEPHPPGVKGTQFSLEKMGEFVREGRNDPRMRAWAGRVLMKAGKPASATAQAQAILNELRNRTVYLQDPCNTELMAKPHVTLCLDEHGLCMPAADCFPAGTLLLHDDMQTVPVEDIRPGDRIWGRDAWTTVTDHWFKGQLDVDTVRLTNGAKVLLTPDHHVFVLRGPNEERISVTNLKVGDTLVQPKRIPFDSIHVRNGILRVRSVERKVANLPCYDISTSDHYVYLPEHDVTVSNCDDRVICMASATMSIGIETMIVGQAYGTEQATHVICAILDPDTGWQKIDPSAENFPVGKSFPATKEWWLDPISNSIANSPQGTLTSMGKEPEHGDFIGVGAIPFAHAYALDEGCEQSPAYVTPDLMHSSCHHPSCSTLGAVPFEHAYGAVDEGCAQSSAYVTPDLMHGSCPRGLGQTDVSTSASTIPLWLGVVPTIVGALILGAVLFPPRRRA